MIRRQLRPLVYVVAGVTLPIFATLAEWESDNQNR
jgi:hypothetical protein